MRRTDEQIINFQKKAKAYARRRNFGNEEFSEDFTSWAVIKFIEGRKARIRDLYTDYLRAEYGDTRTACGTERSNARRFAKEFEDGLHESGQQHSGYSGYERLLVRCRVSQRARACLILKHKWGFTYEEIAHVFGVSGGRVSQIFDKIENTDLSYKREININETEIVL